MKQLSLFEQRRNALFLFFFIVGLSMASWITRTPAIRDRLGVSISEMGMVLFGLSIGSMCGILSAGCAVRRAGTRTATLIGMISIVAGLLLMALGVQWRLALMTGFGLALIGAGMGLSEVAINIDGAHIETQLKKPVLHTLHGCFSLGATCGAALGIAMSSVELPVQWHLAFVAALGLPTTAWAIQFIPSGHGVRPDAAKLKRPDTPSDPHQLWRERKLLAIGFIVLAMAFAEGSANDWLPLLMVDEHGFEETSGSAVFMAFALSMTVGRFSGSYLLSRFGRAGVMRASAISGVVGLAIVILTHSQALAGIGVLLWGLGAALGFPVALSAAGDSGPDPDTRVRVAATAGYMAFLVGPPLLGFVGEAVGLRNAMYVVLILVLGAALAAPAVRPRQS